MTVFKRAWLYITRKKQKSLIMLLILFGMSTAILSGVSIKKSLSATEQNLKEELNAGFQLMKFTDAEFQSGDLTDDMIEKVTSLDGIKASNKRLFADADVKNIELIPLENNMILSEQEYLSQFKDMIRLTGNENSELDTHFVAGMAQLIEGRHITKDDQNKVLISKELAELNQLKVGSKILIHKPSVLQTSGETLSDLELEVVGIFELLTESNKDAVITPSELLENSFITDIHTAKYFKNSSDQLVYNMVSFTVKNPAELESIVEQVKQLPFNWSGMQLLKNEQVYEGFTGSLEVMNSLVNMILVGAIVISIIILVLILTLWIQGRTHETGILLSLGISKYKIISQYILELLMIAVIGFSLSYFAGNAIAQSIGDELVEKATTQSR